MRKIIKNGTIAVSGDVFKGDLLIEGGRIQGIAREFKEDCNEVIDARGKIVIPGGVDVHTHMNLHAGMHTARDDFYSGTVAAACGGTTTIVDHMGFGPRGCALDHQYKVYREYARGNAVIDYGLHGVIQHVDDSILGQMEELVNTHGIPSFKIYMTYDFKIGDSDALRVMERLRELGAITAVHAENHEIINYLRESYIRENKISPRYHALSRPVESEAEAVGRIADIAKMAGDAPLYVVHLSTVEGLERIRRARNRGQRVYTETCPQYLLLDDECYERDNLEGLKYIMSPPLRPSGNGDGLWSGIRDGSIQVVATDHCPFSFSEEKQEGREDFAKCPNGVPGVEERIPLMFSEGVMKGRISLNKFVEVCCTNPARLFGMYPQKGTIAPGSDADIVIIDPKREFVLSRKILHSRGDYTAYEGFKLKGYPIMTLSRGEVIARDNEFTGEKGRGLYIKRRNNSFNNFGFI